MRRRAVILTLALAWGTVLAAGVHESSTPAAPAASIDDLLAAYAAADYQALRTATNSVVGFEELKKQLGVAKDGQFRGAMQRWHRERRPVHSVFMLELAFLGRERGYAGWLDVLIESRKFLVARPETPGALPEIDAFELTWHRAAIALLQSLRRPDLLEEHGIRPLADRLSVGPATPGKLAAPWFAIARGITEEQWAKVPGIVRAVRHAAALEHYTHAAEHESTRREALVRKAGVLLAMEAPADARVALDAAGPDGADADLSYWRWLFLGRAHEALGQPTEAEAAYERALKVLPDAQSAKIALAAMALRRDDRARAFELAQSIRSAPADVEDPWWQYYTGEYRLVGPRMTAVRRMAGK